MDLRFKQSTGTDVVLVQVKSRDFPGTVEMEVIRNYLQKMGASLEKGKEA